MTRTLRSINSVTRFVAAAILLTVVTSAVEAGVIISDFDDGSTQGWTKQLPFGGTFSNPGTGGHPGGFLLATDTVQMGGGLFTLAPAAYTGDLSTFTGIRWDELVYVRGAGGSRTVAPTGLSITGGMDSTTYTLASNPLTVIGRWHTRYEEFEAANFTRSSGSADFTSVISNVTALRFQMDTSTLSNGGPESGIDNVTLVAPVPEPTSFAIFGCGALGLLSMRRRHRGRRHR